MKVVAADIPWLRDMLWSFVPGFSFSEHIISLLLWVLSHPPSGFLHRGHLRCWWALLGDDTVHPGSVLPKSLSCWAPSSTQVLWSLPRNLCLLIHGFCCVCLCLIRVGGSVPAPRCTQDLISVHRPMQHLMGTSHSHFNQFQVRPRLVLKGRNSPTHCAVLTWRRNAVGCSMVAASVQGREHGEQHRSLAGVQHRSPVIPWGSPIPFQGSAGCSALAITCPLSPHFSDSRAPLMPSPKP